MLGYACGNMGLGCNRVGSTQYDEVYVPFQPQRDPRRRMIDIVAADGAGQVAALEFGDPSRPLDVLFLHANGFNASTYRSALAPLAGTMRVLAIDMRGHGRTRLPTVAEGHSWMVFAHDLLALLAALGEIPAVLSGHSMGATTTLLAVPEIPAATRPQLVLFDPVIPPREHFQNGPRGPEWDFPLARGALKRRDIFASADEAFALYQGRGAFQSWQDATLRDFLIDGLTEHPDGTLHLSCSPHWEATNFAHFGVATAYPVLDYPPAPIRILRAENQSTCHFQSEPAPAMVQVETVSGTTHFIPMERPDCVAAALRELAGR